MDTKQSLCSSATNLCLWLCLNSVTVIISKAVQLYENIPISSKRTLVIVWTAEHIVLNIIIYIFTPWKYYGYEVYRDNLELAKIEKYALLSALALLVSVPYLLSIFINFACILMVIYWNNIIFLHITATSAPIIKQHLETISLILLLWTQHASVWASSGFHMAAACVIFSWRRAITTVCVGILSNTVGPLVWG